MLGSAQWSSAVSYAGEDGFYPTARAYAAAFTRDVGHAPDYHNAEATAAGLAFQYAIQRAGTVDRESVRDALARLDVVTFFGLFKFDTRGSTCSSRWSSTRSRAPSCSDLPYRLADARPLYPAPAWSF